MAFATVILILVSISFVKGCTVYQILLAGIIGLLSHYFGFLINDYFDFDLDKNAPARFYDPLVEKKIDKNDVLWFAILCSLLIFFFAKILNITIAGVFCLLLSCLFSIVYNKYSKSPRLTKIIPELSLAISIGLLIKSITDINNVQISFGLSLWIAIIMLILLQLNSIANGLKDIKTDQSQGAESFVIENKCSYLKYDELFISKPIKKWGLFLQCIIIVTEIVFYLLSPNQHLKCIICASVLSFIALWHITSLLNLTSYSMFQHSSPFLYGYLNFSSAIILIFFQQNSFVKIIVYFFTSIISIKPLTHFLTKVFSYYGRKSKT